MCCINRLSYWFIYLIPILNTNLPWKFHASPSTPFRVILSTKPTKLPWLPIIVLFYKFVFNNNNNETINKQNDRINLRICRKYKWGLSFLQMAVVSTSAHHGIAQRCLPRWRVADEALNGTTSRTRLTGEYSMEHGAKRRAEHRVDDWIGQWRHVTEPDDWWHAVRP